MKLYLIQLLNHVNPTQKQNSAPIDHADIKLVFFNKGLCKKAYLNSADKCRQTMCCEQKLKPLSKNNGEDKCMDSLTYVNLQASTINCS